jgi:hypothetical protein
MKRFDRSWVVAAVLLPVALTLGGCSILPGDPSVPNVPAIPGDGSDGDDVDQEAVEEVVEGADGDIDYESGELPADFPADEIPLVPGEVLAGISMGGADQGVWQVNIVVANQAVAETADDLLVEAGFNNESGFAFENEKYLVVVTASDSDQGYQVAYIVTETS